MKLFIATTSVRLQSHDTEERAFFKEEAENIGLTVKENKIKHLDAFGDEAKLYILLFTLTLEYPLEIH